MDSHQDAAEAANALEASLRAQFGDGFAAGSWGDTADGKGRVLDFTDRYGAGRIEVRDDVVRVLDGFPKATFEAVWERMAAIRFERDPKDTWARGTEPDLVAAAAWSGGVVGWNRPDEMWVADEAEGAYSRGDLSIRLSVEKGPIQMVVLKAMVETKRRMPKAKIDPTTVTEFQVGARTAVRLDFDDPDGKPVTSNSLIFVITEGAAVVMKVSAPKDVWEKVAHDVEDALESFVWKE